MTSSNIFQAELCPAAGPVQHLVTRQWWSPEKVAGKRGSVETRDNTCAAISVSQFLHIDVRHPYFTFTQPSFNFKLVASPNNLPHGFTSTGKKNRKRAPKQYEARIAYVYRCQNCAGHATIVTSYQDSRQMAHSMPGPALPAPRDSTQRHVSSARYNNDGAAADSITVMRGC